MGATAEVAKSAGGHKVIERLSIFKLALLALPWIGVQSIWATEFGVVTPVLENYGLDPALASLIWIFGPLTGFFTAPAVGAFSDRSTNKYGRRRPFLLGGLFSTFLASALFAFSYKMGSARAAIGLIAFICLDITINIIQTPLRAFCSDMVPESQQSVVQLLAALFQGLGGILGTGLMRALWTGNDPSELPKLFFTVMAINIFFICLTCFTVHETPLTQADLNARANAHDKGVLGTFVDVFASIPSMDKRIALICAIEFVSWAALFSWWPTASTWFARNVYNGCQAADAGCNPERVQLYKDGTAIYNESGMFANLTQTLFSLALALSLQYGILKRMKVPYSLCLAVGAVFLILAKLGPQSHGFGYMVAILMAVPIAAINSFPFALVGKVHAAKDAAEANVGKDFGVLNVSICLPQLIITFVISAMRKSLGDEGLPWALLIAGAMFAVGAVLALFIREDFEENKETKA